MYTQLHGQYWIVIWHSFGDCGHVLACSQASIQSLYTSTGSDKSEEKGGTRVSVGVRREYVKGEAV